MIISIFRYNETFSLYFWVHVYVYVELLLFNISHYFDRYLKWILAIQMYFF